MKDKPFKLDSLRDLPRYVSNDSYQTVLVVYYLVALGYFLGLSKSILVPLKIVPYLGFRVDSIHQAFRLILTKRDRFLQLVRELLGKPKVTVHDLKDEISHWLFLDNWDEPLPWRDKKHIVVSMATDASSSGWAGVA
ncbi:Hypothetical predicted protein [Paramuricea clavata]|uniref:Uncharacterized protein n=1 Tax=Paramuricea clavata TaxID=317549 RepID=A0A7D9HCC9_PARCT|nr:Hypothetical predicted protein [Paramuricea clavata]